MPEPRQHAQNRNALTTLVGWIPGFHGYLEKEYRRDSDALQRAWLADQLQRSKRAIDAVSLRLADAGNLTLLPSCDRLRAKIDELIARIRGAWEGYTGVFDLVKVDQAVLDRVYEHDVGLMHSVEDFAASLEQLSGPPRQAGEALAAPQATAAAPPSSPQSSPQSSLPPPLPRADAPAAPAAPAMPAEPEAALPLLAAKLDAIRQACDQRSDMIKGLG